LRVQLDGHLELEGEHDRPVNVQLRQR
jgi:hypothetical protein